MKVYLERSGRRTWWRVWAAVAMIALFLPLSVATTGVHHAGASTSSCPYGVDIAAPADLTVSLNGTPLTEVSTVPSVFSTSTQPYIVSLCRNLDTSGMNNDYFFNVLPAIFESGSYVASDFSSADVVDVFTLSFSVLSGDVPLEVEAHGKISSYNVSASSGTQVTVSVSPLQFNDIYGCPPDATTPSSIEGCCLTQSIMVGSVSGPETPEECAARVEVASDDATQLWGSVRFETSTGVGSGTYNNLVGMQVSAASYVYYTGASCPTANPGQSEQGIHVDLGGPHYTTDGVTPATGWLNVYIPAAAIAQCFGTTPQHYVDNMLITRTELGSTTTLPPGVDPGTGDYYTVTADATGVRFVFPTVTYSQPTYKIDSAKGKALDHTSATFVALEKKSGEKLPTKGHWVVAVKAGSKVCVAGVSAIFGYAKGTCSYTVSAVSSTGHVAAVKSGSFAVK